MRVRTQVPPSPRGKTAFDRLHFIPIPVWKIDVLNMTFYDRLTTLFSLMYALALARRLSAHPLPTAHESFSAVADREIGFDEVRVVPHSPRYSRVKRHHHCCSSRCSTPCYYAAPVYQQVSYQPYPCWIRDWYWEKRAWILTDFIWKEYQIFLWRRQNIVLQTIVFLVAKGPL